MQSIYGNMLVPKIKVLQHVLETLHIKKKIHHLLSDQEIDYIGNIIHTRNNNNQSMMYKENYK